MESIVAKNVKKLLNERGLKQGAFAIRAGYGVKQFNAMLNGRKIITDVDISQICTAAQVTPNELFSINDNSA